MEEQGAHHNKKLNYVPSCLHFALIQAEAIRVLGSLKQWLYIIALWNINSAGVRSLYKPNHVLIIILFLDFIVVIFSQVRWTGRMILRCASTL